MMGLILKGLLFFFIIGVVLIIIGHLAKIYAKLSYLDLIVQLPYELFTYKFEATNASQIVILIISMILSGIYMVMNHNNPEQIIETFLLGTSLGNVFSVLNGGIEPISVSSLVATAFSSMFLFAYAKYSFSGSANIFLKVLSNIAIIYISAMLAMVMTPLFEAGGNLCISLFEKVTTVVNVGNSANIGDVIIFVVSAIALCIMAILALFCLLLTFLEYAACLCYGIPVIIGCLIIPTIFFQNIYPEHLDLITDILFAVAVVFMEIIRAQGPEFWEKVAEELE